MASKTTMAASAGRAPDENLFDCAFGFMGVRLSQDLSQSQAAILGIPFDCGTHPIRIGSRYGPQAIREQSRLVRPYQPPGADFNPLTRLGVVDCGNVRVIPSAIEESFERIEEAVWRIAAADTIPVTMGGDGAVTLPQLRALHRSMRTWWSFTSMRTPTPIRARGDTGPLQHGDHVHPRGRGGPG